LEADSQKAGGETLQAKGALRDWVRLALKKKCPRRTGRRPRFKFRARLEEQAIWRAAQSVLFFAPLPEEPDIWQLLKDALAAAKPSPCPDSTGTEELCGVSYQGC